jgi:hypothetical protein
MKHAAVAILFVFLFVTQTSAQDDDRADMTFNLGKSWLLELDPDDQPYPDYLADPRRPRMEVGVGVADSEIPSASSTRVMLDLGTRYTLLKITPVKEGKNEFALDIEGGLFTQFDPGNGLDVIGWDGRCGVFAGWTGATRWRRGSVIVTSRPTRGTNTSSRPDDNASTTPATTWPSVWGTTLTNAF